MSDQYEQEQQQLRDPQDQPNASEITIAAPRAPEVNPEIYKDCQPLLSRGFLMQPAEINGVLFVFKSLNQHEYEHLGFMGGLRHDRQPTQPFWDMFLAYGVYMVDGCNVLDTRDRSVKAISQTFADFTPAARAKLIRHMSELNRRANVATILTEAYATEQYSRYRWAQIKGLDLMSPTVTGIPGTERLGLNYAQLTWRALNYYEDLRDTMEREWENAKFIGACMAGKGMQKVHQHDEKRRATQREQQWARKDIVFKHALLGEPIDAPTTKDGRVVIAAHTTEELSAQLQASLRGEKDWHDQVVEQYEQQIKDRYAEQERKLQDLIDAREQQAGPRELQGGTEFTGLSATDVQERITRRRQYESQNQARRVLYPQLDEAREAQHHKWGLAGPSTPIGQTDRDPSEAHSIPQAATPGRPFRR